MFEVFWRIQNFMNKIKYLGQIIDKNAETRDQIQHEPVLWRYACYWKCQLPTKLPGFGKLLQHICAKHALFVSFVKAYLKKKKKKKKKH